MKLTVGITGGIGAGKSTVSKVIESMGFDVFYSDNEAKKITNSDQNVREELIASFGEKIYSKYGLNKQMLANFIFNDPAAREKVNAIIHPKVRAAFSDFAEQSKKPIVFNEAAILFETGAYHQFDKTILVIAPKELRVNRVARRDGSSKEDILKRIDTQWSDQKKIELADYVIVNDEKHSLIEQVEKIIEQLLA